MKGIEYGINFDAHLQVLKDDPNNPLDLFSIGDGEKFPEDGYLVVGGGDQLIEHVIELVDGQCGDLFAVALDHIECTERKVTDSYTVLMETGIFEVM